MEIRMFFEHDFLLTYSGCFYDFLSIFICHVFRFLSSFGKANPSTFSVGMIMFLWSQLYSLGFILSGNCVLQKTRGIKDKIIRVIRGRQSNVFYS